MNEICFTIPAVPVAQPRQRHAVRAGNSVSYLPKDHPVWAFKATARQSAEAIYSGPPLEGPLYLHAVFVMPRPKRLIWKKRPMPRQHHCARPDRDNLEKALMDAFKGILWRDDSQVCDGPVSKVYAAGDEQPHVEITLRAIES